MKILLIPIAWLYGLVIAVRNKLFDSDILKRRSFNKPVISVGNITMCGTGKTPHTEYIISMLKNSCKVAVLSRGYMRKTKGYVLANEKTVTQDIGDEPFQIHEKFPDVTVAVCEKRVVGISNLISEENVDAIILDDAYQHRYVEPGLNILLVDFHRPISRDHLLPIGMLREPASARKRADVIIVTKCPSQLSPIDIRVTTNELHLLAFQKLFFSTMEYQPLVPLFDKAIPGLPLSDLSQYNILLITAIGSPEHIVNDLSAYNGKIKEMHFRDHHQFDEKDVYQINEEFSFMPSPKIIITTEKDGTRLRGLNGLSLEMRKNTYLLPIKVKIMLDKEDEFEALIKDYVHKDSKQMNLGPKTTTPNNIIRQEKPVQNIEMNPSVQEETSPQTIADEPAQGETSSEEKPPIIITFSD